MTLSQLLSMPQKEEYLTPEHYYADRNNKIWSTISLAKLRKKKNGLVTVQVKRKGANEWKYVCEEKHNLLTNGGRDFIHNQSYTNASAGTRGSGFIALSENASGAAVGHTAVAGEISSGGLARADATTKTHTAGTNTSTIEHTFTASATFSAVQLTGLLNASSTGTLTHENTFTSTNLISGDELRVTWTLTLG